MESDHYESLVALLARRTAEQELFHNATDVWKALVCPVQRPDVFVAPLVDGLRVQEGSSVLLVEAAAAVGKTYFARSLAADTGNPLIDLSRGLSVGDATFTGGLTLALGTRSFEARDAVKDGAVSLIVDAVDEAMVAASLAGYTDAVNDLLRLCPSESAGKVSIVVFGRSEAIEHIAQECETQGRRYSRYQIAFFPQSRQLEFAKQIARTVKSSFNEARFAELITQVSTLIGRAVDTGGVDSGERDSFLGYAPVMSSIARMAVEDDLKSTLNRLGTEAGVQDVWILLREIMLGVLTRETTKIAPTAADARARRLLEFSYSWENQISYLLSESLDQLEIPILAGATEAEANATRDKVSAQIRLHPFLSMQESRRNGNPLTRFVNVAFRDFVAAEALKQGELAGLFAIDFFSDPLVQESPLLARFMVEGTDRPLDIAAFGTILASASEPIRDAKTQRDLHIWAVELNYGGRTVIEVDIQENGYHLGTIVFDTDASQTVAISGKLANASLEFSALHCAVGQGAMVEIGPNVDITSPVISFLSDSILVEGTLSPVRLNGKQVLGAVRELIARADEVVVTSDEASYPWSKFRSGPYVPPLTSSSDMLRHARDFTRLFKWFSKRSLKGKGTFPTKPFEAALAKGKAPSLWFDFLRQRGYLLKEGGETDAYYRLVTPIDYKAAMALDVEDPALRDLLVEFISWSTVSR